MVLSVTTLHSSMGPYGLKEAARVSVSVSQARPWTKILRWMGSESTELIMWAVMEGVLAAASLRMLISWSLPKGCRSFFMVSRLDSSPSSSDDDDDCGDEDSASGLSGFSASSSSGSDSDEASSSSES